MNLRPASGWGVILRWGPKDRQGSWWGEIQWTKVIRKMAYIVKRSEGKTSPSERKSESEHGYRALLGQHDGLQGLGSLPHLWPVGFRSEQISTAASHQIAGGARAMSRHLPDTVENNPSLLSLSLAPCFYKLSPFLRENFPPFPFLGGL